MNGAVGVGVVVPQLTTTETGTVPLEATAGTSALICPGET